MPRSDALHRRAIGDHLHRAQEREPHRLPIVDASRIYQSGPASSSSSTNGHVEGARTMQARMKHPVAIIPAALQPIQALSKAARSPSVPEEILELVHLRVSQINGCSFCVDAGLKSLRKLGDTDERIGLVSAWREAPYYTDAERAALSLA